MSFTGEEDHDISLEDAAALTASYRTENPTEVKGHFFGKDAIQAILDQSTCVGIRIYYGIDSGTGEKHLVIVGADASEDDLYEGLLAERSVSCPPYCGGSNPLNSSST